MTSTVAYILAAIFGILFGSFSNVAVLRAGDWKGILIGHSRCPHCRHNLAPTDLVPLFSFLWLRGRCRYCHKPISWQYPVVEFAGALLAIFSTWYSQGNGLLTVLLFFALLFFLIISVEDIISQEVSLPYCVIAGVLAGLAMWLSGRLDIGAVLLGALAGGITVFLISWIWKTITSTDGMGSGDIWICASVGAAVGWPLAPVAFFAAVIFGAFIGLIALCLKHTGFGTRIPFGPFLALGLLFTLVWGQSILGWYIL